MPHANTGRDGGTAVKNLLDTIKAQAQFAFRFVKVRMMYRASFWIDFLFDSLFVCMQVFIWRALLGSGAVDGVSLEEMTTYVALSRSIRALTRSSAEMIIEDRLQSGNICFDLIRPLSFRRQMALSDAGRCINEFLVHAIPSFILVAVIFGIVPPASAAHAIVFGMLLVLGVVVSYYIRYIIGLISFFFIKASSLSWVFGTIENFLSGAMIPLWFYPSWLSKIASATPFKLIYFTPISVYLGKTDLADIAPDLLMYVIWLAVLVGIESLLWRRAEKRLVVQGG